MLLTEPINTLTMLRAGNDAEPLFFIHPIGGTLFAYKNLIHRLKTNYSVYGIQDNLLTEYYVPYQTLEEQAQSYVQEIFDKFSVSAISFAGLSSGGSLAFEMATQCVSHGIRVKQVLLFDTWVRSPYNKEFHQYFRSIILRQAEKMGVAKLLEDETVKNQWLTRIWQRMELLLHYKPTPTLVSVLLFIATETVQEYTVNGRDHYAWEMLVDSVVKVFVPGNHETLLDAVYADHLGQQVNKLLIS